ncbi:MAG: beta-lactamase family protein [Bacteriovoracaceae bacterium]|nr:beta-lactamase family protein [Bacteriovoracaceae bacterium]
MKYLLASLLITLNAFALTGIDELVNKEIKLKHIPGAVVIIGNSKGITLKKAYGKRDALNSKNSLSTIYDLASLTKVIATTPSIMLLEQNGKLKLGQKLKEIYSIAQDLPTGEITIENLMRHRGGLASGIEPQQGETIDHLIARIMNLPLAYPIDTKTHYSDLSFILLSDVIKKVAEKTVSEFAMEEIFKPLQMKNTTFNVAAPNMKLCALTLKERCKVHDPTAASLLPYPLGHAGAFSTGEDLALMAQAYLQALIEEKDFVLKSATVKKMVTLSESQERGLGWDLLSTYAEKPRGDFTKGVSFGHTGFTGTSIWIDPKLNVYLILLTNRVYTVPNSSEYIGELRRALSVEVVKSLKE